MNLETTYIIEPVEKISPKKITMRSYGSIHVRIEESLDSAAYKPNSPESKQSHLEDELSNYPCSTVCQKIIAFMGDVELHMKSSTWAV